MQALPLSESVLSMFVSQLASEGLTHQTIKCYLSAVHFHHILTGGGDPFCPGAFLVLQYVLRGIKHAPRPPSRPRLPITPSLLRSIRSVWSNNAHDVNYITLWGACCMGFFGFMRAGEFTVTSTQDFHPASSLTLQDIAVDRHVNPSMIRIHLKQSKTDPFRHGVNIYVGQTGSELCPVAAILALCSHSPTNRWSVLHICRWISTDA